MTSQTGFKGASSALNFERYEPAETVTISHAEYQALKRDRACLAECEAKGLLDDANAFGLFTHDPEVAIFLAARYGLMTAKEATHAVSHRFGKSRKPSVAQVRRFWLRFRQCLDIDEAEGSEKSLQR